MDNFFRLPFHFQLGNPQRSLSHRDREIVNFNAVKLIYGNFNGIIEFAEQNLVAEQFFKDFILQTTERNERFG